MPRPTLPATGPPRTWCSITLRVNITRRVPRVTIATKALMEDMAIPNMSLLGQFGMLRGLFLYTLSMLCLKTEKLT